MTPDCDDRLAAWFSTRCDVAFSFLFGSAATGRETDESDVDIAVYLVEPASTDRCLPDVEEPDRRFPSEHEIWSEAERICGRSVDLVVLNRAPATIAAAALLGGRPIVVRDESLYRRFFLSVTTLAEEERDFAVDFVRVKRRSRSLSEIDRGRLVRIVDFLRDELEDLPGFQTMSLERYGTDRTFRRSVERWVENLVNASIDAAKIVLASERLPVPQTYRETLEMLSGVSGFGLPGRNLPRRLAENTRVRNMLAHEYLDLRYTQVNDVVADAHSVYGGLLDALERWMSR